MITGSFTLVGIEDMYAYIITCSSGSTIPTKADGTCKSTVTVSFKKKTDEGLVVFAAPKVIISVSDSGGTELATMTYTNRNAVDVTEMINTAGINSYTLNVSLYDGNLLLASENFLINRDTDVYKFESSTGSVVQCDENGNVIGNVVISVYKNDEPYKEYIQVIMLNKDDSRIRTFVFNTSEKDITENIKTTISENKIAPYKILVESHPSLANISIPDMILTVTYRTPTYIYGKSPWEESNVYKNGNYIEYEGLIYLWDYPVEGNSTLNPKEDVAQNPLTTKWKVYPIDDLLAARVLLADFAKVGQAVFQGNYMLSQQGTDANGNDSSAYDQFDPSTNAFNPNILLDFLTGKTVMNDGTFRGQINAKILRTSVKVNPENNSYIDPDTDLYQAYFVDDTVDSTRLLILPNASRYDGIELSFYHKKTNYNIDNYLVITASSNDKIWFESVVNVGEIVSANSVTCSGNQMVVLKSMNGAWYNIKGKCY